METHQYSVDDGRYAGDAQTLEELNTERKERMSHAASLKNHRRFRPVFPVFPDAMGGTGIPQQGKSSLWSQQMEKLRQHYRKVEKQDILASQMAFEKQWQQWESGLLSEPSCLNVKRNCAGRNRKILNVVARSSSGK
ncbi:hypothetical protein [Escherichia coli]